MIITGLLNLLVAFLTVLLSPLQLIPLPQGLENILAQGIGYIMQGINLLSAYVHMPYILALFSFVLSLEVMTLAYKAIMWILRKIPFFGIN